MFSTAQAAGVNGKDGNAKEIHVQSCVTGVDLLHRWEQRTEKVGREDLNFSS